MKRSLLSCAAILGALALNAQVELFKDINPGADDSGPNYPYVTNDGKTLYFQAKDGTNGSELWMSDGTKNGTVMLKNLSGDDTNSFPRGFHEYKGKLYFYNYGTKEMWTTDGTDAGTVKAPELDGYAYENFVVVNGTLYFVDNITGSETNRTIVRFDGTTVSKTAYDGANGDMYIVDMFAFNGKIYCYARTDTMQPTHGTEMYVFDPSNDTFELFKDFGSGSSSGYLSYFVELDGKMYFDAVMGSNNDGLWVSDGTEANTTLVTATQNLPIKGQVYVWKDQIYFLADDANAYENLFVYNPTADTVEQLTTFQTDHDATSYIEIGNYLYYRGENEASTDQRVYRILDDGKTVELVDPSSTIDIDWIISVKDPNDKDVILLRGDDDGEATQVTGQELYWLNTASLSVEDDVLNLAKIYPNPATDILNVSNVLINAPYTIYDVMGKTVQTGVILSEKINLNLNAGLYIFNAQTDHGTVTKKLVIKN